MRYLQITKINTLYFSATGTTRKVVRALAQLLAEQLALPAEFFDFTLPAAREQVHCFPANELTIIGVPVYAGRVPNVLLPFLTQNLQSQGAPVIPVVLYGNRSFDDALMELCGLLETNGFVPIAAGALIGEHAFSRVLAANRPDAQDLQKLERFSLNISQKLSAPDTTYDTPILVPGNDPIRPYYTPRDRQGNPVSILKVKPVTHPDLCTRCGLCAQLCPMGSISSQDVSVVAGICIKCCACVKKCPKGAKYFTDENYLYHQHELEEEFSRRAEPEFFL